MVFPETQDKIEIYPIALNGVALFHSNLSNLFFQETHSEDSTCPDGISHIS